MAAEESINEFVSASALKQLDELKIKIDAAAKSMEVLITETEQYNKQISSASNLKEYTKAVEDSKKSVSALDAATAKLAAAQTEEAQQLAIINAQLQAVNKGNRDNAKSILEQDSAYKKLNKEYQEAAQRAKDLTAANAKGAKEAAAQAHALGQRLKDIDASVGQFNRNVGNYAGGIKEALGNNIPIFGQATSLIDDASNAVSGLAGKFGTLKAAIAATGIGVFLIAAGAIISFLKEFDPLMDAVEQETAAASEAFTEFGSSLFDLVRGKEPIFGFWDNLGKRMRGAANDAREFTKIQQDLDDRFLVQQVKTADAEQRVAELRVRARNKALSPKEKEALLKEGLAIEQKDFQDRNKIAEDQWKTTFVLISRRAKLSKEEVEKFHQDRVQFAVDLLNDGRIREEHLQKVVDAENGLITIRKESSIRQEKIQNDLDRVDAEATAKALSNAEKRKAAAEKEAKAKEKILQEEQDGLKYEFDQQLAFAKEQDDLEKEFLKRSLDANKKYLDEKQKEYDDAAKLHADEQQKEFNKLLEIERTNQELRLELARTVSDSIGSIIAGQFDAQKNAIQDQIDANDRLKESEIEKVANSVGTEQEKADKIAVINAQSQAKKEQLERKQRELDQKKAVADKAKAVFDIILSTSIAVMRQLETGNLTGAALVGAIGGAQLAAVLARPIPKFAKGTDNSPEGPAWVGEKGRELIITPSGQTMLTPDTATLTYLDRGSKVIPNHKLKDMALDGLAGITRYSSNSTNDYKILAKATIESSEKITKAIKNQQGTIITEGGLFNQYKRSMKIDRFIKRNIN